MNPFSLVFALALATIGSWWLSGRLRRYALDRQLIDHPNARSSHDLPTPRGGGLAFVVVMLAGLCLLMVLGEVPVSLGMALLGGGSLVAAAGWLDDHGHVPARWRLLAQGLAVLWALAWIGPLGPIQIAGWVLQPGLVLQALAFLVLVWMVNVFNFMDGIDAIASLEAISVAGVGALLLIATSAGGANALPPVLPLLLASAVLGFLPWNWPPARLFMGDVGSGILGFTIGLFTLQASHQAPQLTWSWLILSSVFWVDATLTLLRRLWRSERVWQAHRSHAYQRAAQRIGAHRPVSLGVLAINLVWLAPSATLVAFKLLEGSIGLILAVLPLLVVVIVLARVRPLEG